MVVAASCAGSFLGLCLFVSTGLAPWPTAVGEDCSCDAPAGVACCNGDVNGDHSLNLADAVFILQHLFNNGPGPAPLDCRCPRFIGRLPATGQRECYNRENEAVDCAVCSECVGQDGYYQAGLPWEGRFTDNEDGTVTDNHTGLMWPQFVSADFLYTWWDALQYCEDFELAGYTDWRFPNNVEMNSLVDLGRGDMVDTPAMDSVFDVPLGRYWSSTTLRTRPHLAIAGENVGPSSWAWDKTLEKLYVIPVRTIQPDE
jgi:hypothetical protein